MMQPCETVRSGAPHAYIGAP